MMMMRKTRRRNSRRRSMNLASVVANVHLVMMMMKMLAAIHPSRVRKPKPQHERVVQPQRPRRTHADVDVEDEVDVARAVDDTQMEFPSPMTSNAFWLSNVCYFTLIDSRNSETLILMFFFSSSELLSVITDMTFTFFCYSVLICFG